MRLSMRHASAAIAFAAMVGMTTAAHAVNFVGNYGVTLNSSDPGLVVAATPTNGSLGFSFSTVGQHQSFNLFDLYTNESSVELDDLSPKAISVKFDFSQPSSASGTVSGDTYGESILFGLYQDGHVNWSNGGATTISFSDGAKLNVTLNDATFDGSLGGLFGGSARGAEITGDFRLTQAPTVSAAPEPSTWALMLGGIGVLGGALRLASARRRELSAFCA